MSRLNAILFFSLLFAAVYVPGLSGLRAQPTGQKGFPAASDIAEARALLASGNYPEAIGAFQSILRKQPSSEAAAIGLADAYRSVHNLEEARSVLVSTRRLRPKSAAILKALGSLEIEAQSWDAAIAALQQAVALAPRDAEARNFLASALQGKGGLAAAIEQLDRVLAENPQDRLAQFMRAQCEADLNQNAKALADAQAVLHERANYLPARTLLAKVLIREKQCARAVQVLRPSPKPPPESTGPPPDLDTQALFLLANAYECAGQPRNAAAVRDDFARASEADRQRSERETQSKHLVEQAGALAQQNRFPEALALLDDAIQRNPRNAFAFSQQAKIFFSEHEFDHARAAIAQALAIQPYQPDFLYVKGVIAEHDGNDAEAVATFKEVTRVNPKEADAFFEIGKIRLRQGDRNAARAAFEQAAKLDPQDPEYQLAAKSAALTNP